MERLKLRPLSLDFRLKLSLGLATRFLVVARAVSIHYRKATTRKIITQLSADQLRDIGVDEQPDGRFAVSARLMTRLMSMR